MTKLHALWRGGIAALSPLLIALTLFGAAPAHATGFPASCPRADGAFVSCDPVVVIDPATGLPIANSGGAITSAQLPSTLGTKTSANSLSIAPASDATFSVVGYDSGPIIATATPANSSHAAGVSVGGLFSLPLARTAGGSGIQTSLGWTSVGGSTGQLVIREWDKSPANSTCIDNTAFSGSAVDDAFLITPPFTITPAAPGSTTGDSKTYAASTGLTLDYKNVDTAPGQNIYICAVTVATDTADENHAVTAMVSGPQN